MYVYLLRVLTAYTYYLYLLLIILTTYTYYLYLLLIPTILIASSSTFVYIYYFYLVGVLASFTC